MSHTIHAPPRRRIALRDFRRGLRRFTMRNEAMAYYNAHPEAWAEIIALMEESVRRYGPSDPVPRHTKLTLRGEVFRPRG